MKTAVALHRKDLVKHFPLMITVCVQQNEGTSYFKKKEKKNILVRHSI